MAKKIARRVVRKAAKKAPKASRPRMAGAAGAIRQLDRQFMQAAEAKDAETLVEAFYAQNAVLMPPNHPAVEGRAAIQRFLQGLMDSGLASIALETTKVESAGDLAYGRGRYTLSMSGPGEADRGKYVVVYRQTGGKWQAVADIFNSDQGAG
jgi:ketosteroid isomerase-like protein